MAKVIPFRGVRYNKDIFSDLFCVTTPPYDVISNSEQQEYYEMNEHNIIRLELGKESNGDNCTYNKYTRASQYLNDWLNNDILVRESEPAFYIYIQEFFINNEFYRRTGIIGNVRLHEFSEGIILPHENTLSKAKEDRLHLMRACNANFSQIFSLYNDNEHSISNIIYRIVEHQDPDIAFMNKDHVKEMMWVITDKDAISHLQNHFKDKQLFIADGHHRYETALNYRKELQEQNINHTGEEDYNYIMMMLVDMDDPGLVVLPTHRIIKNVSNVNEMNLIMALEPYFTVTKKEINTPEEIEKILQNGNQHTFVLYNGEQKGYEIILKDTCFMDDLLSNYSQAYRHLDVNILQTLILEKVLGITKESLSEKEFVTYTRNIKEGIKWIDDSSHQLAFFLNATDIYEVKQVAIAGEKMPQKSTYFYPKLQTGLVLHVFE